MNLITRTLSVLALSAAVASPVTLIGAASAEAYELKSQESAVTFVKFKKHHGFKKHHSFKKQHHGFKKHRGFKKHHSFKKFHHFKHF